MPTLEPNPVVEPSPEANITAFMARQRANRFAIMELDGQFRAEEPSLLLGERACWSVPLAMGFPGVGQLGRVGEVLVDAITAEATATALAVEEMHEQALCLVRRAGL